MIVVEGCDGTGKTTLVNSLVQDLHLNVGLRGTANRDELYRVTRQDTYTALSTAVLGHEGTEGPLIWDRLGPFSDPIYARVRSRDVAFTVDELKFCESIFKVLRCPVILCSVPLEVAEANQEQSHQMEGVSDNFKYIWEMYNTLRNRMLETYPNFFVYDYRMPGAWEEVVARVRTYIEKRKVREWHSS